ncbi:Heavy metal-associated isoprenylated plant protein 46 [Cardamine amara subsp. amara]|uniref:Heavy metal-associated isoprenylated plant protein 46 n=1 Tax=Cardamine amara subsp. amara TaxID=228776 RepID=A0ABD0ZZE0_CARAN
MKQKILIRVTMTDDKTRAKVMTKAVQFKGVSAVEIKGNHRNQIEVTGDEVDMITLTKILRKKIAFAELVSVTKVEPPKAPDAKKDADKKDAGKKDSDQKDGEKKGSDDKKPPEQKPVLCYPVPQGYGVPSSFPYPCHPNNYIGEPVYNHEPNCIIM